MEGTKVAVATSSERLRRDGAGRWSAAGIPVGQRVRTAMGGCPTGSIGDYVLLQLGMCGDTRPRIRVQVSWINRRHSGTPSALSSVSMSRSLPHAAPASDG